jgi:DNA-binding transcriptional regulator YdaS (Cro superfamily)
MHERSEEAGLGGRSAGEFERTSVWDVGWPTDQLADLDLQQRGRRSLRNATAVHRPSQNQVVRATQALASLRCSAVVRWTRGEDRRTSLGPWGIMNGLEIRCRYFADRPFADTCILMARSNETCSPLDRRRCRRSGRLQSTHIAIADKR